MEDHSAAFHAVTSEPAIDHCLKISFPSRWLYSSYPVVGESPSRSGVMRRMDTATDWHILPLSMGDVPFGGNEYLRENCFEHLRENIVQSIEIFKQGITTWYLKK